MGIRIGFFTIAAWLLAAHFFRAGEFALVALCAAAPLLFFHRRRRSLIALQVVAWFGVAIWAVTAVRLVQLRMLTDQPWLAAAIILGAVAVFTAAAGLLLRSRSLAERYPV